MKVNIFIKSFNRAYYLDRCIQSIFKYVHNGDYSITILDDGTQPKCLNKIKDKYPEVVIIKSEYYEVKTKKIKEFIEAGVSVGRLPIPAAFWKKNILASTDDYILVLEDDMWITQTVDLAETLGVMREYNMPFMKLFFFNNSSFLCGTLEGVSNRINSLRPKFTISSPFIVKDIIIKNKYKSFSILQKLGVLKPEVKFDYYTLYSVAGGIFTKEYYKLLWENSHDVVNEDLQLSNAYDYYYKNNKEIIIGCFKNDVVNTSFSSSATNMFSHIDLNVFQYNYELNEAWYKDQFNPMAGYPKDIDETEIITALSDSKSVKIEEWKKWKSVFLQQYTDIGLSNE